MDPIRIERINALLVEELNLLVQHDLSDPRVASVTVTRVATSRDLTSARVFVHIPGAAAASPEAKAGLEGLRSGAAFLRRQLAASANLRRTPDLIFTYDDSARIQELIDEASRVSLAAQPPQPVGPRPHVEVIKGDITALEVDAIANAANTELRLGSGVAGAILARGGASIQEECDRHGAIPLGEAVITGAGRLSAQAIIHAAAMGYRAGEAKTTEASLEAAFRNTLLRAEERRFDSLAIPAIGTGVGGLGLEECAAILRRVLDTWHAENHEHPRRLIVCLYDDRAEGIFRQALA